MLLTSPSAMPGGAAWAQRAEAPPQGRGTSLRPYILPVLLLWPCLRGHQSCTHKRSPGKWRKIIFFTSTRAKIWQENTPPPLPRISRMFGKVQSQETLTLLSGSVEQSSRLWALPPHGCLLAPTVPPLPPLRISASVSVPSTVDTPVPVGSKPTGLARVQADAILGFCTHPCRGALGRPRGDAEQEQK